MPNIAPTTSAIADLRSGLSRRHFLQAAAASAAAGAIVPAWLRDAAGATPIGSGEGIVVVVTLRGGWDGLSVLVPRTGARRAAYDAARGSVAVSATSLRPATDEHGFHPALDYIAQRYAAGNVAVIQGVGLARPTRSHFDATGRMHSANDAEPLSGWVGRHIDDLIDETSSAPALALSQLVPLHLSGRRRNGTVALPLGAVLWGGDTSTSFERAAHDTVRTFAAAPTGLGPSGDAMAEVAAAAVDEAATLGAFSRAVPHSSNELARALETAARAINADIGLRVIAAEGWGYDSHASQHQALNRLLPQLDAAIDRFFSVLDPARRPQVSLLVQSEFGRTVEANASLGTDHGRAGLSLLVGDNVTGGIHGEAPSLTTLDSDGNLIPNVDQREIYASILTRWLGGDADAVLGTGITPLDLFRASPGVTGN